MLLCAIISALGGCAATPPPKSAESALHGKPVPTFSKRAIDGARGDTKKLAGRVVVVKFIAKYCEPCKKTLPAAERLHRDHPEVVMIGIAEDEYRSEVQEVIDTYHLSFPIVHDAGNILSGRFRVSEMPSTFVIDKKGTVRWVAGERQTEDALRQAVEAFLK